MTSNPALYTDRYELTMLSSFIADGTVNHRATFEAFARKLPAGRRYGIVAGLDRILRMVEQFTFDADDIDWLLSVGAVDDRTAEYLRTFKFRGDIDAYREGDVYFPGSPVLTVTGTLGECVVLETLILSVLNHDIAVAGAAARMVTAAAGRPIIEMGSRRTHEEAALAAARAAYLAGFASTSNLAAGRTYGIPTVGTAAHAFTLAHTSEVAAFTSQVAQHGPGTTLLVDTYDIPTGIENAVAVAGTELGAIRIDSGDLAEEAVRARAQLDNLGATDTRIVVTSDLDEYLMADLATAPINGYGAGTRVVTGSGHPTAGMVYKLVAIADQPGDYAPMRPVAKKAASKGSTGGRKTAWREYDQTGTILREVHAVDDAPVHSTGDNQLHVVQVPAMRAGRIVHDPSLECARKHTRHALASLPTGALDLADGNSAITPEVITPAPKPQITAHPTLQEA